MKYYYPPNLRFLALGLFELSILITPQAQAGFFFNQRPIANAGADQTVNLSATVTLDGSQSYDPDGSISKYKWVQTKGTKVTLLNALAAKPTFKSPTVTGTLAFSLTVTDNKLAMATDTVEIKVLGIPTLTINKSGTGTGTIKSQPSGIDCGITCSANFAPGTVVKLTAIPSSDSTFFGWGGLCVGTGDCTVTVTQALQIDATFDKAQQPPATNKLNDTGIISCSDGSPTAYACPLSSYPGQDAEYGRDITSKNNSDGYAGFSFTKISNTGSVLLSGASSWNCVRDNVTGLTWEAKTSDTGLHNQNWTYTWYNTNSINGGLPGTSNGGSCGSTSACDTAAYVQAVNAVGWCGAKNWRLPTVDELSGIASLDRTNPALDTDYFPNTPGTYYWSSSPDASTGLAAWVVDFNDGAVSTDYKNAKNLIRLVHD